MTLVSYHLEEGSLFCFLLHPDNLGKSLKKISSNVKDKLPVKGADTVTILVRVLLSSSCGG